MVDPIPNGSSQRPDPARGRGADDRKEQGSAFMRGENNSGGHGETPAPAHFIPLDGLRRKPAALDDAEIRRRLSGTRGRQYWKSLEELAETPEFQDYVQREFPHAAPRDMSPVSRREFFRLMGATLALAGAASLSGCGYQPAEGIIPYVDQPEEIIPGKPLYYATGYTRGGYAIGLLGETHMARPTKLEGNPDHPASLGSTDVFGQATLLTLYDPDRTQAVRALSGAGTWDSFEATMLAALERLGAGGGDGFRILISSFTSPTLAEQLARFRTRYPQARIHTWEPVGTENVRRGLGDRHPVYHFQRAQRVLSLDSNFLHEEPGSIRYAREFISGRLMRDGVREMNRLYAVETSPTITGAKADHRVAVRASQILAVAQAVADALGEGGVTSGAALPEGVTADWVRAVAEDLNSHRGSSLILAGEHLPAEVHALAHRLNQALGNVDSTVTYLPSLEVAFGDPATSLSELVADMAAGRVDTLVVIGSNPVYTAPADLDFPATYLKVPTRVHMGLFDDETGVLSHWHLPQSHELEAWGDARAYDGTPTILQPLITPLYASRSPIELMALLLQDEERRGYEIVRSFWQRRFNGGGRAAGAAVGAQVTTGGQDREFEQFWHRALVSGMIPISVAPPGGNSPRAAAPGAGRPGGPPVVGAAPPAVGEAAAGSEGGTGLEIVFRPDPMIWDGSYANNAWLQELPKPITSLTWGNAAQISPLTARRLGLVDGDGDYSELARANGRLIEIVHENRRLVAPIWITPGHANDTITLTLGYGRPRAGRIGNGLGYNAYQLRLSGSPGVLTGAQVARVDGEERLANAQHHFRMEGRDFVVGGTQRELREHPERPPFMPDHHTHPSLYPPMWPSDQVPQGVEATEAGPTAGVPDPNHGAGDAAGEPAELPGDEASAGTWSMKEFGPSYTGGDLPPAWGMVIDLNACIGCNACTIACQAENNIATVGKDQVLMSREMHWIRIDNYFVGDLNAPDFAFQPVPCMHCENAPCEPVCPVEATSHSAEGINEMTYNRCIGTRYCSNNCPYKVRRFNFLQYSEQFIPTIELMRNPDVTVRARGVMEKCTFCIQRINNARIEAEKEERFIRDGDILTACQQVCPTQAIVFGDVGDTRSNNGRGSRVRQLKESVLNYGILTELNTKPRTSYLAALSNPNPALDTVAELKTGSEENH
ncbi:MAG: TAT-variant-translocated molybdopterin oxidoreductase [Armatimonadota bacterium]